MTGFKRAVSVVTGAASGIGREFAVELGRRRGRVVVADIDEEGLAETAELVRRAQGEAHVVRCDVRHSAELQRLADATEAWAGTPDLAVLNAGILVAGPLASADADAIDRLIAVNVTGVVQGCRIFAGPMLARGRGSLLNVGSVAGLAPIPQLSAYAATKAAVVGLSKSLHAELRPGGVGVTVLCPSFTRTGIVDHASTEGDALQGTMHNLGQRVLERAGADAHDVIRVGLAAAARGKLYAIDSVHARLAWHLERAVPRVTNRLASLASRRIS
ncbi:MAG: SDR family NAD(P)-dependent oxidoreductase [Myxococcota bacterium]